MTTHADVLRQIRAAHLGDCPATMDELAQAKEHIVRLRHMAHDALKSGALTSPTPADMLENIVGHLGAILSQTIASDDQIIIGHVRSAYELASSLWNASRRAIEEARGGGMRDGSDRYERAYRGSNCALGGDGKPVEVAAP